MGKQWMGKGKSKLKETDLYPPLRDYLVAGGYRVHGEVHDCDLAAFKDGKLILVEQKLRINLDLLIQAVHRQKIADSVYVAVPHTEVKRWGNRWSRLVVLLRRLELGLILVSFQGRAASIEIVFHPLPYQKRKNKRLGTAVIEEMNARSRDVNLGGSNRRPIMTAYKENALQIAVCLEKLGPTSAKKLRALGTGPKTLSILANNFLGWFERIERGVYRLKDAGYTAITQYPEIADRYQNQIEIQLESLPGEEHQGSARP
jgi:hypothetical protein